MPLLSVNNLWVSYGAIQALRGISLHVEQGEIVTLIGGNGAGKSTTLRTISGLLQPRQGDIQFNGLPIQGRPPHDIVVSGLVQVPEGRGIFANLTVDENLKLGAFTRTDHAAIQADRGQKFDLRRQERQQKWRNYRRHRLPDPRPLQHVAMCCLPGATQSQQLLFRG